MYPVVPRGHPTVLQTPVQGEMGQRKRGPRTLGTVQAQRGVSGRVGPSSATNQRARREEGPEQGRLQDREAGGRGRDAVWGDAGQKRGTPDGKNGVGKQR